VMDVVYPYRYEEEPFPSLLYSIRSMENVEPFNGVIWVVGDIPPISCAVNCIQRPKEDKGRLTKDFDIFCNVYAAVNTRAVSDPFIYAADDHYVCSHATLQDLVKIWKATGPRYDPENSWPAMLWEQTKVCLARLNLPCDYYETHHPKVICKHWFMDTTQETSLLLWQSAYFNRMMTLGGFAEPPDDIWISGLMCRFVGDEEEEVIDEAMDRSLFMNFTEKAVTPYLESKIREKFSAPSRFEN
jgi:hypothetical protein